MSIQASGTRKTALAAAGAAMTFVVLMGIVSLLADVTYEGARSLHGQYLRILGASAAAVGVVAGAGELLGYGVRFLSGYAADRSRRYWAITILGYGINLLAVPGLALTGRWEAAVALLFLERAGKGIRSPARDAMLSYATSQTGRGLGYGLHEALDQIGAVAGPLVVGGVLWARAGAAGGAAAYRSGYALLAVPAVLALGTLAVARRLFPRPSELESKTPRLATQGFSRPYWLYLAAVGCFAAGFADFALMAYHFKAAALAPEPWIPMFYALAMGIDALAALALGRLYDRVGLRALVGVLLVTVFFAPLVFLGNLWLALVGLGLWGIGMGAQESIMRAAVADLLPAERRATGFGLFHTGFGIAWFLGSALMGVLYDRSRMGLVVFSVVVQLGAVPVLVAAVRQMRKVTAAP